MNLYFECKSGISGDMSVGALLDLGASREKLDRALKSINLENEFEYKITEQPVNSIKTTDFDVVIKGEVSHCHEHHHEEGGHCHHQGHGRGHIHRNLDKYLCCTRHIFTGDFQLFPRQGEFFS